MRNAEDRARRRAERLPARGSETEISRQKQHTGVLDLAAHRLADEFLGKLEPALMEAVTLKLEPRLRSLEKRIKDLEPNEGDDGDVDEDGTDGTFPNLKYAEPKYKDIESVLRYVESGDNSGGLKLVIMNFND